MLRVRQRPVFPHLPSKTRSCRLKETLNFYVIIYIGITDLQMNWYDCLIYKLNE